MTAPVTIDGVDTIYMYRKKLWENVVDKSPIYGMLKAKAGLVQASGSRLEWPVQAGTHKAYTASAFANISALLSPQLHEKRAYLNWGLVVSGDAVAGTTLAQNRRGEIIVDIRQQKVPDMMRSVLTRKQSKSLGWMFYHSDGTVDGDDDTGFSTDANALPMYGVASIAKAKSGASSADQVVSVDTTAAYAGLYIGAKPSGVDNVDSTVWLPKLYNHFYPWDGSSVTFASNFKYILNRALADLTFDASDDTMQPDCVAHDRQHYADALNYIEGKETVFLREGATKTPTVSVGSGIGNGTNNKIWYNGLYHWMDPNIADDESWILNWDQINFHWLQLPADRLNVWEGRKKGTKADEDGGFLALFTQQATNRAGGGVDLACAVFGQFQINPKHVGRIYGTS